MRRRETAISAAEEWERNMDSCETSGEGTGSQGALRRTDLGAKCSRFPSALIPGAGPSLPNPVFPPAHSVSPEGLMSPAWARLGFGATPGSCW